MSFRSRRINLWKSLDWFTIGLYLLLIAIGWSSVCGASYDYGENDFFDFSTRAGKQFVWIVCSFGLAFVLLMLEDRFYEFFAYFFYIALVVLLVVTIFIAPDIKGSRSWLQFGPVSLQPAEFAKFATALALAKFMNFYHFNISKLKDLLIAVGIVMLPFALIVLQKEAGSALVYMAFFLVLYREGMPGGMLFVGVCAILFFIVGIRFDEVYMENSPTSIGEFAVLSMALLFTMGLLEVYFRKRDAIRNIFLVSVVAIGLSFLLAQYFPFNLSYVLLALCVLTVGYLIFLSISLHQWKYLLLACFTLGSIGFFYSTNYVFDNILEAHHRDRFQIVLGMKEDLSGAGYNVYQSKIAIGSGGLTGKGFLNGTQTKLKYVPEQDTDFIFCTIGEEQGFVGSVLVLLLFLALILRLIFLSERQLTTFGRVYGYSVASIFVFHLMINLGMVLGLTPVIGIPLPFFSYGGSSLWGFTILLFVFLRIDAGRGRAAH